MRLAWACGPREAKILLPAIRREVPPGQPACFPGRPGPRSSLPGAELTSRVASPGTPEPRAMDAPPAMTTNGIWGTPARPDAPCGARGYAVETLEGTNACASQQGQLWLLNLQPPSKSCPSRFTRDLPPARVCQLSCQSSRRPVHFCPITPTAARTTSVLRLTALTSRSDQSLPAIPYLSASPRSRR